jgi:hypothetical protein
LIGFVLRLALELGSKYGNADFYMHKKGVRVIATEGLRDSVRLSLYPAIQHHLTKARPFKGEGLELIEGEYLVGPAAGANKAPPVP